jgi:hypothetical protein
MNWPLSIEALGLRWVRDYYVSTGDNAESGFAKYENTEVQMVIHVHQDGEEFIARLGADSACVGLQDALEDLEAVVCNAAVRKETH